MQHLGGNHNLCSTRVSPGTFTLQYFPNRHFLLRELIFLSNYAKCNVIYAFSSNLKEVKQNLSQNLLKLSEWFHKNRMILNLEKRHYMCLRKDSLRDLLRFCGQDLEGSELETILRKQIDKKLNFEKHIKSLCTKAPQKLGVLQRISNLLDVEKKNLLFNSIIKSQFSYCPLAWMFCSRRTDSLMNSVRESSYNCL